MMRCLVTLNAIALARGQMIAGGAVTGFVPQRPAVTPTPDTGIPTDCMAYFDGCNRCGVQDGAITMCTRMACKQQQTPYCSLFSDSWKFFFAV